jgi:flagellar motor switch/type III secretory pathway protein FliN
MSTLDLLNRFQNLPFPIEVEVGSFELSIRELLDLKPGQILGTSRPANAPLTLRAGDAPIASVEVVQAEEAISVRVRNILANSNKVQEGTASDSQAKA